jgi:hypothetical protein
MWIKPKSAHKILSDRCGEWFTTRDLLAALGVSNPTDDDRNSAVVSLMRLVDEDRAECDLPPGQPTRWRVPVPKDPVDWRDLDVPEELPDDMLPVR